MALIPPRTVACSRRDPTLAQGVRADVGNNPVVSGDTVGLEGIDRIGLTRIRHDAECRQTVDPISDVLADHAECVRLATGIPVADEWPEPTAQDCVHALNRGQERLLAIHFRHTAGRRMCDMALPGDGVNNHQAAAEILAEHRSQALDIVRLSIDISYEIALL